MTKHKYEIVLRSKEKHVLLPDTPRDFGGAIPGGLGFSQAIIEKKFSNDAVAMWFAKKEAKGREMVLLRVTKTLYDDMSKWKAG